VPFWQSEYFWRIKTIKMTTLGLIGYPLGHSFSEKYFTEKFESLGLKEHQYNLFPIETLENVRTFPGNIPGLIGLNVTVPYKKQIINYLDELDNIVSEVGAVNTVRIRDGIWKGYNTDVTGFRMAISDWQPMITERKALILGSGGGAYAASYVLDSLGLEVDIISRHGDKNYSWIKKQGLSEYALIVQCTPLGMWPAMDSCPVLDYSEIGQQHFLFDMVYNPEKTIFLARGEYQGATIRNGLDMLKFQAEAAWEIWNQH
jgi:shikimate dehydrogenase